MEFYKIINNRYYLNNNEYFRHLDMPLKKNNIILYHNFFSENCVYYGKYYNSELILDFGFRIKKIYYN